MNLLDQRKVFADQSVKFIVILDKVFRLRSVSNNNSNCSNETLNSSNKYIDTNKKRTKFEAMSTITTIGSLKPNNHKIDKSSYIPSFSNTSYLYKLNDKKQKIKAPLNENTGNL